MANLDEMTVEELEVYNAGLSRKRAGITATKREIARILDQKRAARDAKASLDRMSDGEKAALAQALQVDSIESNEAFGTM